jgi:hypothetical protein
MNSQFANLIFEIINYSKVYIVVLDRRITIRFINYPLASKLGFKNVEDPVGRCWLDFIPKKLHENIKTVHASILCNAETDFREFTNDVMCPDQTIFKVKWYNTAINNNTFWTFSFGIPLKEPALISEDAIRLHFKNIIESDRTVIQSLKDFATGVPEKFSVDDACEILK